MGIEGSIQITIEKAPFTLKGIEILISDGWTLEIEGRSWLLPLGDQDEYNWQTVKPISEKVFSIMRQKYELGEMIGIGLRVESTHHGLNLLIFPDRFELLADLSIHRRTLPNISHTDFSWYLQRLLPSLTKSGLYIGKVECIDLNY